MPTIREYKSKLMADPEFAKLSYNDQLGIWNKIISRELPKDEKFNALGQADKLGNYNRLSLLPPVLSDNSNATNRGLIQYGQQVAKIKNDPNISVADKSRALQGLSEKLNASSFTGGLLSSPIGKLAHGVTNKMGVAGTLGFDTIYSDDGEKIRNYYQYLIQGTPYSGSANTSKIVGNILGEVIGFYVARPIVGAAAKGVASAVSIGAKAARAPQWIQKVAKWGSLVAEGPGSAGAKALAAGASTRFGSWLAGSFVPWVVGDATLDGITGLAMTELGNVAEGKGNTIFKNSFMENLKTFGKYAAMDYAFGAVASVAAPFIKLAGKVVKDTFNLTTSSKPFVGEMAEELAGLRVLSPEKRRWYQDVAPSKLDVIDHNRYINEFSQNLTAAHKDPVKRSWLTADSMGKVVVPDGGGFRIREMSNKVDDVIRVANYDELNNYLVKQYQNATPEQIEYLLQQGDKHTWLRQASEISKSLDSPYGVGNLLKGVDDSEVLSKSMKNKNFTPVDERPLMHPAEYMAVEKSAEFGGYNVLRGDLVKLDDGSLSIFASKNGKSVSIVDNVATGDQFQEALIAASKLDIDGVPIDAAKRAENILLGKGFDAVEMPDGSIKPLFQKKIKQLSVDVDMNTGKMLSKVKKAPLSDIESTFNVKETLKADIPADSLNAAGDSLVRSADNIRGLKKATEIDKYAKEYADTILGKKITTAVEYNTNGEIKAIMNSDGVLELNVPRNIPTSELHNKVIKTINETLAEGFQGTTVRVAKNTPISASKNIPGDGLINQQNLLKTSYEELGGSLVRESDAFIAKLNGNEVRLKSLDEVWRNYLAESMGSDELKAIMELGGYKIVENDGGTKIFLNGNKILETPYPFKETFVKADANMVKVPSEFEQHFAVIDSNATVEIGKNTFIGNKNEALTYFSKFEDYGKKGSMELIVDKKELGQLYKHANSNYEIVSNKYGYSRQFNSVKEARLFLENIDDAENLFKMLEDKGLQLSFVKDNFIVKGNGKVWQGKNAEELAQALKDNPIPSSYPDIFPDSTIEQALKSTEIDADFARVHAINPAVIKPDRLLHPKETKRLGVLKAISVNMMPTTPWIVNAAKKMGDENLLKVFTNMEDTRRIKDLEAGKYNELLGKVLTDDNGKFLSVPERRGAYHLLTGTDESTLSELLRKGKAPIINDTVRKAAENVRAIYDDLAKQFGIDPKLLLEDYMPRMMRFINDNKHLGSSITGRELFEKVFKNGGPPKEMDVFFEHQRSGDIAAVLLDDDVFSVTSKYIDLGMKKAYMEDSWKQFKDYINTAKNMDGVMVARLATYMDNVMGYNASSSLELAGEVGKKLLAKLAPKMAKANPALGNDLVNTILSMNYLTSMSLKPWLGIRNLLQPWHTFGPRFGITKVNHAYQKIAKDPDKYITKWIEKGVISKNDPIMNVLSENFIGKLTHKGLKGFGTSDRLTRVIGAEAIEETMTDAIDKLNRGIIKNMDEFKVYTNLNLIDNTHVQKVVMGLVEEGEYAAATSRYATQAIEETLFAYRPSERPLFGSKTLLGKLFWQYGTYSSGYAANLVRMVKNGTAAQRIGSVVRLAAVTATIAGIFKSAGIDSRNFMPWTPLGFNGGPLFDLSLDIMKSFGSGWESDQARQKLKKFLVPYKDKDTGDIRFGNGIPFSYQINNLQRGLRALEEGNNWDAWLFFTNTPLDPEKAKYYY